MLLMLLSIIPASILLLAGVLLAWSPGQPQPFVDANGQPLAGANRLADGFVVNALAFETPLKRLLRTHQPNLANSTGFRK